MMKIQAMMLPRNLNVSRSTIYRMIALAIACVTVVPPDVFSESRPLENLLASPELRSVAPRSNALLKRPAWLDPDSSYAQFYFRPSSEALLKAVGNEFIGYKILKPQTKISQQYIEVEFLVAAAGSHQKFTVRLYLPHPALLDLAEKTALPRQLTLIPSESQISSSEIVVVKEEPVTVMMLSDQSYILMNDLPMQGKLFLTSPTQASLKDAINFFKEMNVADLKTLLSS